MTIIHLQRLVEHQWHARFAEVRLSLVQPLDRLHCITGRKLKCDGRSTCANCERRNIPCTYVPVCVTTHLKVVTSDESSPHNVDPSNRSNNLPKA